MDHCRRCKELSGVELISLGQLKAESLTARSMMDYVFVGPQKIPVELRSLTEWLIPRIRGFVHSVPIHSPGQSSSGTHVGPVFVHELSPSLGGNPQSRYFGLFNWSWQLQSMRFATHGA